MLPRFVSLTLAVCLVGLAYAFTTQDDTRAQTCSGTFTPVMQYSLDCSSTYDPVQMFGCSQTLGCHVNQTQQPAAVSTEAPSPVVGPPSNALATLPQEQADSASEQIAYHGSSGSAAYGNYVYRSVPVTYVSHRRAFGGRTLFHGRQRFLLPGRARRVARRQGTSTQSWGATFEGGSGARVSAYESYQAHSSGSSGSSGYHAYHCPTCQ